MQKYLQMHVDLASDNGTEQVLIDKKKTLLFILSIETLLKELTVIQTLMPLLHHQKWLLQ